MLNNYFKITLRNLWKNKTFTFINIIGLSIAFGSSLLLFMMAFVELSYDNFHKNGDKIYRLIMKETRTNTRDVSFKLEMTAPLTPVIKEEVPEIEFITRYLTGTGIVDYNEKRIDEPLSFADADFLNIFSFKMLKGNPKDALNDLGNAILTQDIAKAIFNDQDPLNKQIKIFSNGEIKTFIVTGIIEKAPKNSHINPGIIIRFENCPSYQQTKDNWGNFNHNVFVLTKGSLKATDVEKKLKPITQKYFAKDIKQMQNEGAKPDERGEIKSLRLQPITDIHFNTQIKEGNPYIYLYMLIIISALIIIIAFVNFINLAIARSLTRAREVGVRKVLGAKNWQIIIQFWGEAIIICLTSFVIGLLSVNIIFEIIFRTNILKEFQVNYWILALTLSGFLATTLIAGGYPAWLISRFQMIVVLKGKITTGKSNFVRNSLIITQFSIAILLIISTLVIYQQIHFFQSLPLGFNTRQVISIPVGEEVNGAAMLRHLRNNLGKNPEIMNISAASNNFGRGKDGSITKSGVGFKYNNKTVNANIITIDYDFLETLDLKLIDGRDFSKKFSTDSTSSVLINEQFAVELAQKKPVGTFLDFNENGKPFQVIGMIKDFHFESLHNKIEPQMILLGNQDFSPRYIFIKIADYNMSQTMQLIERTWKKKAPESKFKGSFMDENTSNQYKREKEMVTIFTASAGLAIFLSCMGLFAIAVLSFAQRTKEVGIRKVLGASLSQIVTLLTKEFLKLVLIAFLIAAPLAWYIMNLWLQNFAYKIEISWWTFAIAGILSLLIALITVSFQAIKAAIANPVESLRSE